MNLTWKLTGMECLTLYYDSVEELGQLACFKCLFFASSRIDFRIEYVAFTLLTRGNSESDQSLKRFWITLQCKMTIKKTTRHWGQFFLLQNLLKFRLKCLLTFFSIQNLCNITLPPQRSSRTLLCFILKHMKIYIRTFERSRNLWLRNTLARAMQIMWDKISYNHNPCARPTVNHAVCNVYLPKRFFLNSFIDHNTCYIQQDKYQRRNEIYVQSNKKW